MMLVEQFAEEYVAERLAAPETFAGRVHRIIEGVATTSRRNSKGRIIHPFGAKYTLPLPLLLAHNWLRPVGEVTVLKLKNVDGASRLEFVARIATHGVPAIDEVWEALKAGVIGEVSPLAENSCASYVICDYRLLEVSICETGTAANPDCVIEVVKELDLPNCVHLDGRTPQIIYRDLRTPRVGLSCVHRPGTVSLA